VTTSRPAYAGVFIHPTAIVDAESIGQGTRVWAFCNLLPGTVIGKDCQICDRVFIETGARIGDEVTIKCGVSVWNGVELERGVFVGPGAMFTNDPSPRSGRHLSAYPRTIVRTFASLGAGSVLLPGVVVGAYALVGAGAVVTRDVKPFALVVGNPAKQSGWVCVCAARLRRSADGFTCSAGCGRTYGVDAEHPVLLSGDPSPRMSR
jgi:UDP-2-acetamido-3-amino-2,3-dideoxy-glucuronate N-acetyltransferase